MNPSRRTSLPSAPRRGRGIALGWALVAGLVALSAFAQDRTSAAVSPPTGGGPAWSALSPTQQQALAPLQREWSQIDANRKAKWLDVAARFPKLPPDERVRIQQRMADWARLTPAERGRARLQFQESRQLAAEDRQALWEAYQSLPEQRRVELANKSHPIRGAAAAVAGAGDAKAAAASRRTGGSAGPSGPATLKPISPTAVQVRPGATTTLLSQPPRTPAHQQSGLPKIAATEGFVDPKTLLPRRGPQGAAAARPATPPNPPQAAP